MKKLGKFADFFRTANVLLCKRGSGMGIIRKQDVKVWDLIFTFEEYCKSKGWKAHEDSDLIEAEGECLKCVWVNKQKLCEEVI